MKNFTVRIDEEKLKQLEELAKKEDRSVGNLIRRAINIFLIDKEDENDFRFSDNLMKKEKK